MLFGCSTKNAPSGSASPRSALDGIVPASECGVAYPEDFPCLGGGNRLEAPARMPFPGVRVVAIVGYPGAAADVARRIGDAAIEMGWILERAEQGPEPSGARYRSTFTRDGRELATSVWPASSGSVLQIMTFDAKRT